jgi:hypothetical protein
MNTVRCLSLLCGGLILLPFALPAQSPALVPDPPAPFDPETQSPYLEDLEIDYAGADGELLRVLRTVSDPLDLPIPEENFQRIMTRLDKDGNVLWQRTDVGSNYANIWPEDVLFLADGGCVVLYDDDEPSDFFGLSLPYIDDELGLSVFRAILVRFDGQGEVSWLRVVDEDHSNFGQSLEWTPEGNVMIRGSYGRFPNSGETPFSQIRFADGSVHPVPPLEFFGGRVALDTNLFVAVYDLDGDFLAGHTLEKGRLSGTHLTATGEKPLAEALEKRGLLYFDRETAELVDIDHQFPLQIYERVAPDLVPFYDRYRTDRRIIERFSNGSYVVSGRGSDRYDDALNPIARTYYFAFIDSDGVLQQSAILDNWLSSAAQIVDDDIWLRSTQTLLDRSNLPSLFPDFDYRVEGDWVIMSRGKGPFSGLAEWSQWRQSADFGWAYNFGNNWWYLHRRDAIVYIPGNSGLTQFWLYESGNRDWQFTMAGVFPWYYSWNARTWSGN